MEKYFAKKASLTMTIDNSACFEISDGLKKLSNQHGDELLYIQNCVSTDQQ
jgi:hypothetical protein